MFTPPVASFGCDHLHLPSSPLGWPLEELFISAGQDSRWRLAQQLGRFYYVNAFLVAHQLCLKLQHLGGIKGWHGHHKTRAAAAIRGSGTDPRLVPVEPGGWLEGGEGVRKWLLLFSQLSCVTGEWFCLQQRLLLSGAGCVVSIELECCILVGAETAIVLRHS